MKTKLAVLGLMALLAALLTAGPACPGNDDDDDADQEQLQPACAIQLPNATIAAGESAVIEVLVEQNCEGVNWSVEADYTLDGTAIDVDASAVFDIVDDDGWCGCGTEYRTLTVDGLAPGTYTVNATCYGYYAVDCNCEDEPDSCAWVEQAVLTVE